MVLRRRPRHTHLAASVTGVGAGGRKARLQRGEFADPAAVGEGAAIEPSPAVEIETAFPTCPALDGDGDGFHPALLENAAFVGAPLSTLPQFAHLSLPRDQLVGSHCLTPAKISQVMCLQPPGTPRTELLVGV